MKKIKLLTLLLIFSALLFTGCNKQGDYQYIITMKDGSRVKAWSATTDGGGLDVYPPWGCGGSYSLSSTEYKRVDYVGCHNGK
jgi:hypothetical protein